MKKDFSMQETELHVREIVAKYGRLDVGIDEVSVEDNLSEAGMSSHASVDVMLALEDLFGELPEVLLTRSTFESIRSITVAMQSLIRN